MDDSSCSKVLCSFVDTFIDFCVSDGIFLPPVNSTNENAFQTSPPDRLIALGDLHGDLPKTKESLRLAGLIDSENNWSGGSSTLVQIGDVLDRGGHELKILYFLEKLRRQAVKDHGNVITMNGNHEIMNVDADFRYVTPAALDEFNHWAFWFNIGSNIKNDKDQDLFHGIPENLKNVKPEYVQGFRSRIAALRPNGPIAKRFLSKNLTVLVIGDSVFVHGGMLPSHVAYGLENINQEVKDWISGDKNKVTSSLVRGRNSLVWLRIFSNELAKDCDCSMLQHVLETIPGARRMIMGHTIQESGINGICDNKAIRIDVGMSQGCINGLPEVLEITKNSGLRIITSNPVYQQKQQVDSGADGMLTPLPQPKQVQVEA
ncbi:shewanella-like protein phosphatase 2 [Tanacetum coccineum]